MLEEIGSGGYWGAVYSPGGERIGISYVDNDERSVTVHTGRAIDVSSSPASFASFQKGRAYVGSWQDSWGFFPGALDDSHSDDKKGLGRSKVQYVGNPNTIKAWRKAQSNASQSPVINHDS